MAQLDDLDEEEVAGWFPAAIWRSALQLENAFTEQKRVDARLEARCQNQHQVTVLVQRNQWQGECTCPKGKAGKCKHVAALLAHWLRHPIAFAPQTEAVKVEVLQVRPAAVPSAAYVSPGWLVQSPGWSLQDAHEELQQFLEEYTVVLLRSIAAECGWSLRSTLKSALADQFASQMASPQGIAAALAALNERERELLAVVAIVNELPFYTMLDHSARLLSALRRNVKRVAVVKMVETLARAPLVFSGALAREPDSQKVILPQALWPHLPPLLDVFLPGTAELPAAMQGTLVATQPRQLLDAALHLLVAVDLWAPPRAPLTPRPVAEDQYSWLRGWEYDAQELPGLLATLQHNKTTSPLRLMVPPPPRRLSAATLQQLDVGQNSVEQTDFLFALLEEAGLFLPGSPVQVAVETRAAFLRQPPAAQLAILFDAYSTQRGWQEGWEVLRQNSPNLSLVRLASTQMFDVRSSPEGVEFALRQLANLFLAVLAWLPEERWISVLELEKLLFHLNPKFDEQWLPDRAYSSVASWFLSWQGQMLGYSFQDWQRFQGAVLSTLLQGPLVWLGLVDLNKVDGAATHFSLHGLASLMRKTGTAIALDRTQVQTGSRPQPLTPPEVEGEQIRLHQLAGAATLLLEKIALPLGMRNGDLLYRLEGARVHTAFESGATPETLLSEWEACFGQAAPDSLREPLLHWWQGYGAARIYQNLTLIEFSDEYALQEVRVLAANPGIRMAELSSNSAVIPVDSVDALVAALQRAGHTPKVMQRGS